jgi:maltose/moltooligosaccharide transporter
VRAPTSATGPWTLRAAAIGLAYFSSQMAVALYNAYLPIFYGAFVASNAIIGLIMVIDNVAAMTLQPYFGGLSDRVDTRWGRRTPFLLAGMPLTALAFALIPRARKFAGLFAATVLLNAAASVFTSPSYVLMPDTTPSPLRSRANGIINLMGGLGALVAFFFLSELYRRSRTLPFDVAAGLLVASLGVILWSIPERRLSLLYRGTPRGPEAASTGRLLPAVRAVVLSPDRSLLLLLAGAWAAVAAVNGVQNMFTRYGVHHLGLDPSGATQLLGFFAAAFLLSAVPAGSVGDRIGRLRAIRVGVGGTLAAFVAVTVVRDMLLYRVALVAGGVAWALWVVNAYPFLIDRVTPSQAGTYTGVWNAVLGCAGLASPPVYGLVVDALGFGAFFLPGIVFMGTALACVLGIREGNGGGTPRAEA